MTGPAQGRRTSQGRRWHEARDGFLAQLANGPDGRAFEGLAQALWWLDDGTASLAARDDAYRFYRQSGDDAAAACAATAAGYDSFLFGAGESVARGWLGRAHALLDPLSERAEHGWLLVREAELTLATADDPNDARLAAEQASRIGRGHGDDDLFHVGTALSGLAQTMAGDPRAGMPMSDSAVAAATTGEVTDPMWMGKILCWLIVACQQTQELNRADEWCRRVETVCRTLGLDPLFTVCRIQHSSILLVRGTWQQAEENLTRSMEATESTRRHTRQDAVVLLGELRRRQGRWDEAETLLAQAEFDPGAIVSRALIRSARGQTDRAWADVRAVLSAIPASNRLARAQFLLAGVITADAAGAEAQATEQAIELHDIAAAVDNAGLTGMSLAAEATVAGPPADLALWREAVRSFHQAGMFFDEAQTRVKLATALLGAGDPDEAAEQVASVIHDGAQGHISIAVIHARALDTRIRAMRSHHSAGDLSARETEVLRLVVEGMTNGQIAAALTVSPHTVHRHIANILTKLDQPSRAAAAAYAVKNELL